jgi:hypothetical protein
MSCETVTDTSLNPDASTAIATARRLLVLFDANDYANKVPQLLPGAPYQASNVNLEALTKHLKTLWVDAEVDLRAALMIPARDEQARRFVPRINNFRRAGAALLVRTRRGGEPCDTMAGPLLAVAEHELDNAQSNGLAAVVIVASDRALVARLGERCSAAGVTLVVVGPSEVFGWIIEGRAHTHIDPADIDGFWPKELARSSLWRLPADGHWFEPTGRPGNTATPTDQELFCALERLGTF